MTMLSYFFAKSSDFALVYFGRMNVGTGNVHLWIYGFQEVLGLFIIYLKGLFTTVYNAKSKKKQYYEVGKILLFSVSSSLSLKQ